MSYASIDDLRSQLGSRVSPEAQQAYDAKMMHPIPDWPVVDREKTILQHCTGKRVLEFGASGSLSEGIRKAASAYLGVDRQSASDRGVVGFDLDDVSVQWLPQVGDYDWDCETFHPDVIVCGEVLEHLSNPGWFLARLRRQYANVLVIVTVPNAFSTIGRHHLLEGIENVNVDHVAWYSPRTLRTLLERAGYTDLEFAWYHGKPITAEGLIVSVRA
jgi:2-polyprenyl-3-methyl-5-hydroxy-6-metoxy-1,4-benzoquinol methylase